MGYLRKKLRRSRCRAQIDAAYARPFPPTVMQWLRATDQPLTGARFVRLSTDRVDRDSNEPQGVFAAAYELCDDIETQPRIRRELKDLLAWLDRHLRAPGTVPPRAIFWFRADATQCIDKIWELVTIVRDCGVEVSMMQTNTPGRMAYRDELQVAAIPFADRRS